MASALITSAKRGAYVAIGLYLALVVVVSISSQLEHSFNAPIDVASPGIQFEHRTQNAAVDHAELTEALGV
ncbi:hypothetical protein GIW70_14905 [Pseudomonas syringae]|nr:hypothetical protein [Pseudomonas syringae]MCF5069478.1 hypothetical protein [Pseudomonas syringae]